MLNVGQQGVNPNKFWSCTLQQKNKVEPQPEENFSNKNSIFMSDISTEDSMSQIDEEIKVINNSDSQMPTNIKNDVN